MSYAGTYGPDETCKHNNYYRNCTECQVQALEKRGTYSEGILHADNGAGFCIGHIEDGRCTVLVRHCSVLNTPEQVAANRREDYERAVSAARIRVIHKGVAYDDAKAALEQLIADGPESQ